MPTTRSELRAHWQSLASELRELLEWLERREVETKTNGVIDTDESITRIRQSIADYEEILARYEADDA